MAVTKPILLRPKGVDYKTTAFDLKLALLWYYRFKRQWVSVDECDGADIVADTGKHTIEVEVKISRADLLNGEKKKAWKHMSYAKPTAFDLRNSPNKYYFCVPCCLEQTALEYAQELNSKYGVMVFDNISFEDDIFRHGHISYEGYLRTARNAHLIHGNYSMLFSKRIAKRASSKLITQMQVQAKARTEALAQALKEAGNE